MTGHDRNVEILLVAGAACAELRTALRMSGFHTTDATDAAASVVAVTKTRFAVIMLSLDVPGMETRELIRRLHDADPAAAVGLFARAQDAGRVVSTLVHGVDVYLPNPPSDGNLLPLIHRAARAAVLRRDSGGRDELRQKLEMATAALDDERARVTRLRTRMKKLETSIGALSTELRRVVEKRREIPIASPPPPVMTDVAEIEEDDWSESSTTSVPMLQNIDAPSQKPPLPKIDDDPFADDMTDATDPVDRRAIRRGDPMFIGEVRDELSDLLRAPARPFRPPMSEPTSPSLASKPSTLSARPAKKKRRPI